MSRLGVRVAQAWFRYGVLFALAAPVASVAAEPSPLNPSSPALCVLPIPSDPRIRHVISDGGAGLRLDFGPFPAIIEFADADSILDVALGGASGASGASGVAGGLHPIWDVHWRVGESYFFIEPRIPAHEKEFASLTVRTARRSYVFDLVADPALSLFDPRRIAKLVIEPSLDRESKRERADRSGSTQPQVAPNANAPDHVPTVAIGQVNRDYSLEIVSEVEDIRPRAVFDDGHFTYLRFPGHLAIPAIYRSTPGSREEQLENSHLEGDTVVMHGVAPLWTLRLGGSVLGVFNDRVTAIRAEPLDREQR